MPFRVILLFFTLFRLVDISIIILAQRLVPYLGFFSYPQIPKSYHVPNFIAALANFDGVFYIRIARAGYSEFEQAFFPLYPFVIKIISPIFAHNHLLTGLLISNISFLIGLFVFGKYIKKKWPVIFLLAFPTSFFFGAVYTEGLFFLLIIGSLYFLKKGNYVIAGLCAVFASATRVVGIFLIIPFAIEVFFHHPKILKSYGHKILFLLSPLFGFFAYCMYLFKTTGDAFFFLTSQPLFGAQRSTKIILLPQVYFRYFKIFISASHDFHYYVSLFEFLVFNFVFIVLISDLIKNFPIFAKASRDKKIIDFDRLGLNLFSLANLLIPALTGTFSSIPRYALLSLAFFIALGKIKNQYVKISLALIFFILHVLALSFFAQGYFMS